MEPLTFVLGIASTILSNVISDLITGKSKTARKVEIEKQVAVTLLHQSKQENQDLRIILHDVMREIEILSKRDPDLRVREDRIELRTPIKKSILPFSRERLIQNELTSRLDTLGHIIAQRREELGLPINPEQAEEGNVTLKDPNAENLIPPGWAQAGRQQVESKWARAIKETEDRIQQRRSGEAMNEQANKE